MTSLPDHVYRLATHDEWVALRESGVLPTRDIDKRDGYIHLSTRGQVLETAALHFAGSDDLLALEIETAAIADQLKFELAPKRKEAFPHLYGPLRLENVNGAFRLERAGAAFSFGAAL